jgi:TonB-dependent receptor
MKENHYFFSTNQQGSGGVMKKLSSFLILFVIPTLLMGQSTLRGVVSDSTTHDVLVGVNVVIVGTGLGAATDLNGEYIITRIPERTFTVRVTCVGYETKEKQINFALNRQTKFDASLTPMVIGGKEFVVTAQRRGQIAAINQQLTANTITNVISEEKIQELPDANAAEAIGRLPGVSVLRTGGEASSVVMRGMSSKFALVTIDGVRMAPTSDVDRSVDLSTISQGSLAGIELSKALTSDKDADAIAGSVNLVTKKAPSSRMLRFEPRGSYNALDKSANQYNGTLRYGERFLDNRLGVQVSGNLENTIRSNESTNYSYDVTGIANGTDYQITQFQVRYIHELRKRGGGSLLLDYDTPDGGAIRLNTVYDQTSRNYLTSYKQYPQTGVIVYDYRQIETNIGTFNSSLQGENYLLGWEADWGLAFSQSRRNDPFDFEMNFTETSASGAGGQVISGMRTIPPSLTKGPVEQWIPYAVNNFNSAFINNANDYGQENLDREQAAHVDLLRKYTASNEITGEFKFGGKFRRTSRFNSPTESAAEYYLYVPSPYTKLPDGTIVPKNLTGTQFENLQLVGTQKVSFANFLFSTPPDRLIYGKYDLNPLINVDGLKLWRQLNINGYQDAAGRFPEYVNDSEVEGNYYDLQENISAGYAMNTLNLGHAMTVIAGLRYESEDNRYTSKFTRVPLSGFPFGQGALKDTTVYHKEHELLPNLQGIIRPTDFMNVRLAAYEAIARPDFSNRLLKFVARSTSSSDLNIGNPDLKSATAWNYEVQTQFYGGSIGLFSVSAFYKNIKNMYHTISGVSVFGQSILDSLGVPWKEPFGNGYFTFTYPYNSTKPTHVWGFEVEHQANFNFLPEPFTNIVLNYNFTIVRSETWATTSRVESYRDSTFLFGRWIYTTGSKNVLFEKKQKLEDQPEFFGNASLGYDMGGFSFRLSVFHQGSFNSTFSSNQRSDGVTNAYTRWDVALKQDITDNISVLLNLNNITNTEEGTTLSNRITGWLLPSSNIKYGMTADLGVRLEL